MKSFSGSVGETCASGWSVNPGGDTPRAFGRSRRIGFPRLCTTGIVINPLNGTASMRFKATPGPIKGLVFPVIYLIPQKVRLVSPALIVGFGETDGAWDIGHWLSVPLEEDDESCALRKLKALQVQILESVFSAPQASESVSSCFLSCSSYNVEVWDQRSDQRNQIEIPEQ